MVTFLIKVAFAAIPAMLIIAFGYMIIFALFSALVVGHK
jgi:hypothetical protein